MVLFENDDPDWFLVKEKKGTIGLVPSNYIEDVWRVYYLTIGN